MDAIQTMNAMISNFKSQMGEIIKEETLNTLNRLRTKIFKSAEIEDDFEIDTEKFAENTLKKIMEESEQLFTAMEEQIKKAAEKSPKLKKDPDAPKPSVNAYIHFSRDNRDEVKEENPSSKASDITKIIAQKWKEADEDLKQEYKEKAEQDKVRYEKELENYEPKEGFVNPKEKKSKKKAKKSGPSKPLNAYMWFCKDKREELKNKGLDNKEILREMGKLWKNLSDKKKKPYNEKAEQDKERYAEEMKNYPVDETEKKGKKGKKVKATGAPKRPLGAFMLFRKDTYDKVKSNHPDMKMPELMKKISEMWKELDDKKKKKYTDNAAKLLAEFKNKTEEKKEDEEEVEDVEDDEEIIEDDDEEEVEDEEEEEEEEIKIPSSNTPKKCMPNIVSDAKFAQLKAAEKEKEKAEKEAAKNVKNVKNVKKDDAKDVKDAKKTSEKKEAKTTKKASTKNAKKANKDEDEESILSDDE
jgi:high mobility group protein B1